MDIIKVANIAIRRLERPARLENLALDFVPQSRRRIFSVNICLAEILNRSTLVLTGTPKGVEPTHDDIVWSIPHKAGGRRSADESVETEDQPRPRILRITSVVGDATTSL